MCADNNSRYDGCPKTDQYEFVTTISKMELARVVAIIEAKYTYVIESKPSKSKTNILCVLICSFLPPWLILFD